MAPLYEARGLTKAYAGQTVLSEAGDVEPFLATEWEVGEDADGNQTYTFSLRDDIPWVKYDPISGETSQEVDEDGNPLDDGGGNWGAVINGVLEDVDRELYSAQHPVVNMSGEIFVSRRTGEIVCKGFSNTGE